VWNIGKRKVGDCGCGLQGENEKQEDYGLVEGMRCGRLVATTEEEHASKRNCGEAKTTQKRAGGEKA
jgi:hypothetical protein